MASEGRLYVHLYANIPTSAVSAQQYTFALKSTSLEPGTVVPYAASGTGDLATVDTVIVGGSATMVRTASQRVLIDAPDLTVSKTVKVLDNGISGTFNCASGTVPAANDIPALPGACVEYTITLTNAVTATSASSTIVMRDPLPTGVEYVSVIRGDFDTGTYTAGTRTVNASKATLNPGESASFRIRATVAR